MMLGDKVDAAEAERLGMVYRVIDAKAEDGENEALKCAKKLAVMPTVGLGLTKRALNTSMTNNLEEQLDVEEKLQTLAGSTEDYSEGVNAFLEKRQARFKGK